MRRRGVLRALGSCAVWRVAGSRLALVRATPAGALVERTMTSDNAILTNKNAKLRRERRMVASCADCFVLSEQGE
ncbi:MAG TPA: hypothetical protein VHC22_13210 [Pirellulales bacterium]|nr:hypothetical protein [Pirellulales bacterium]